jgi:hypothetical protein
MSVPPPGFAAIVCGNAPKSWKSFSFRLPRFKELKMASQHDGDDLSAGKTNNAQSGTELVANPPDGHLGEGNDYILQVKPGLLLQHSVDGIRGSASIGGRGVTGTGGKGESGFLGGPDPQFGQSAGVYGESTTQGVMGLTTTLGGTGVYGGGRTAAGGGQIGVRGETSTSIGVHGTSFGAGTGVQGTSNTGIGVVAEASNSNLEALFAHNNGSGLAAFFVGGVRVQGNFTIFGGSKSAAVPHPDGSHRLLYCLESPESWFEDFGEGQLVDGKGEVRLDPDFAALVEIDGYHVFVTPYGESKGLFVAERYATGFRVCEQQGGTNNASFAYRVVAKRKDIVADRLATVTPPREVPSRAAGGISGSPTNAPSDSA